jgi:hypothetical protein
MQESPEEASNKVRKGLSSNPAARVVDSMAVRISVAMLFLTAADVELYQPFVLPFALQLSRFLMLALGLSPRRVEPEPKAKRKPCKKARSRRSKPLETSSTFKRQPNAQRSELSPGATV